MPRRNPWTISISGWEGENSDGLSAFRHSLALSVIPDPLSVIPDIFNRESRDLRLYE